MANNIEDITDKTLREVYSLLTKEQLIELLIKKNHEHRILEKNKENVTTFLLDFLSSDSYEDTDYPAVKVRNYINSK